VSPRPAWVWKDAKNLAPTGIRLPNRPFHKELLYRQLHPSPVYGITCAINWNKSYLSKWISQHLRKVRFFVRSFHIQYFIYKTLHLLCKNINDSVRQKYIQVRCSSSNDPNDIINSKHVIRLYDILNLSFSHTDKSRLHYKDPLARTVHVKVRC
jgi:hypothetical protein